MGFDQGVGGYNAFRSFAEVTFMQQTLAEIIAHHAELGAPEEQPQLIALLQDAQANCGGVLPQDVLETIASQLQVKEAVLRALIRRIPSLRLSEAPHRLEVCGRCAASRAFAEYVEKRYGAKPGGVSQSGGFSCHVTGCMKNCRRGPSIRWDGELYSEATAALIDQLAGVK